MGKELTLRQKQSKFAWMVHLLIFRAYELGYEVTIGDVLAKDLNPVLNFLKLIREVIPDHLQSDCDRAVRITKSALHKKSSSHYLKLAIDLNIFKDGVWLTETEDHRPLGEYWKTLGGTWGGDFRDPDGNHYSYGE